MQKNLSEKMLCDILGAETAESAVIDAGFERAYEKIREMSGETGAKTSRTAGAKTSRTAGAKTSRTAGVKTSRTAGAKTGRATGAKTSRTISAQKGKNIKRSAVPYRRRTMTVWKKVCLTAGSLAAVLCIMLTFCVMNPVMAREIPILGSIFSKIADVYLFGKLPEEGTVVLTKEEGQSAAAEDPTAAAEEEGLPAAEKDTAVIAEEEGLSAADGGITISVTEEYVSNQAAYIGFKVENEQAFPEMVATVEDGMQFIKARTMEKYSFLPEQRRNRRTIEGKFIDAHTFVGVIRIDYGELERAAADMDSSETAVTIPESFTMELEISEIASTLKDAELPEELQIDDETFDAMSPEEQTAYIESIPRAWYGLEHQSWHQAGTWRFTFPIAQTDENVRTITVNQINDQGIGVERVKVSSMELSVDAVIPDEENLTVVVLDASGREIPYKNGSNEGAARLTAGYDISTVTVYLCDITKYADLLENCADRVKSGAGSSGAEENGGENESTGSREGGFRKALEEISKFKTVVKIPEQE